MRIEAVGKPRNDFVLHVEEIDQRLIETLSPEMMIGLRINELDVHANAIGATLNASFHDIADIQVPPELLHVDRLALKGERRVARDDESALDAR